LAVGTIEGGTRGLRGIGKGAQGRGPNKVSRGGIEEELTKEE